MGFTRRRTGSDGTVRFVAMYRDLADRQCSAGTFARRRDADRAWQRAEARLTEGRSTLTRHGAVTFREYVAAVWLPNHVIEASTKQSYSYSIEANLMPTFGAMRMVDVMPLHVRQWVQRMVARSMSPATIRSNRIVLSAIFTTALNDQVTVLHPCKGVKTPTVPVPRLRVLTPVELDRLLDVLPDPLWQVLVETAVESGLRWGELTELRVNDLDRHSGILTVSRAVVALDPKHHPDGARFLVKPYPKSRRTRRFKLSRQIVDQLVAHIDSHRMEMTDLLFAMPATRPVLRVVTTTTGELTTPNAAGRRYRHGTLSAYTAGTCRCETCRAAFAGYRAARRGAGKDSPRRVRRVDTDGHIPGEWFRRVVWRPALLAANIDPAFRIHDLRHAHASWLLAGGADLQVVKERLGHSSIATTEKYLHTLPGADETALEALAIVRGSRRRSASPTWT